MNQVDPCTLLAQADYPDYYLDGPGKPGTHDNGAANCLWQGEIGYMGVTLSTHEGVEAQEGRLGQIEPADSIEGFPSFTIRLPGDDSACSVAVDVADSQNLKVQVGLDAVPAEIPSICEYAHQFAGSVMSTLVEVK